PAKPGLLPASLPGVTGVVAADHLQPGQIIVKPEQPYSHETSGRPRDLDRLPPGANLWGNSFACSRVTLDLALKMKAGLAMKMASVESVYSTNSGELCLNRYAQPGGKATT
ncbi:MAG: hypothetical protein OEL80_08000, partial [Desulfuromonadales bacterium]|nr:hypothetical protein [Desulfuromonadales bacterium]